MAVMAVMEVLEVLEVEGMAAIQAQAVGKVRNSPRRRVGCHLGFKYELGSLLTSTQVPVSGVASKH